MTAKRFTIDKKGGVFYLFDNGNLIPIYDGQPICDLLNELHEEIERLKEELDAFKPVMFQDMRKGTVLLYAKRYGDVNDF